MKVITKANPTKYPFDLINNGDVFRVENGSNDIFMKIQDNETCSGVRLIDGKKYVFSKYSVPTKIDGAFVEE